MPETDETDTTARACPDCHALVADAEAHLRWHAQLVSALAKAVEAEIKHGTKSG